MSDRRDRYEPVIRTAMSEGPEYVHGLWTDYFDHSATGLSEGAARQLGILNDIRNYPPALLKEAEEQFPVADVRGSFTVPHGYTYRRKGLVDRLLSREVGIVLHNQSSAAAIKLSEPLRTDMRFPWQLVIAANEYLRRSDGTLLASRYLQVGGSIAYEMCYASPLTGSRRAEVGIVCKPLAVVRVLLEAPSLDCDKGAFDEFLRSLR